ncbi:MAG: methionine--tRNA ligase subunit beta [Kiritimatiellaceae bacterium]|nr:methionine--tRNA ligase subunit beta [Kiritimatiellaceae bacterium]
MSKSLGNVVNPMDMIDRYGVDAFRYFLISEMTLGQDASFTEEAFVKRYNSDLANDLGNVANRVLNMISRYCDGKIPHPTDDYVKTTDVENSTITGDEEEIAAKDLWEIVQVSAKGMGNSISTMKLDAAVATVMTGVRAINQYLQDQAPWALAKQGNAQDKINLCLYTAAECLRVCAGLLYPVMPEKMLALRTALGMADAKPHLGRLGEFGVLIPGSKISQPGALFPRIEVDKKEEKPADKPKKQKQKPQPKKEEPSKDGLITFDQVMAVNLKTAVVLEAEKIEDADKLLKLQIDLGGETRQLVAGIALHYKPEELVGKTIVVVANLKPAKLRGVKSEGMLLAASIGDNLKLVTVEGEMGPGAAVK